jgi:hypothetical protein
MTAALLLPTFESQLLQIADAERHGGWLNACMESGCFLLLNRPLIEAIAEQVNRFSEEPRLEVCAGQGELSEALTQSGVPFTATDAAPPAGSPVSPMSAREALERHRPAVVLGSFVPIDAGVDEAVLACRSVKHYIALGARLGGEFGSRALWRAPGWRRQPLPQVGRWMLTRHDVWTGRPHQPILRHGEAWCFSRENVISRNPANKRQ